MNQRSRNRRRHAAVPFGQLVQRHNGRRIAQHHGDLAALVAQRSLTLGAGLGLFHRSIKQLFIDSPLVQLALQLCKVAADFLIVVNDEVEAAIVQLLDVAIARVNEACRLTVIAFGVYEPLRADAVVCIAEVIASDLGGLELLESHGGHGALRSGLIPPMCESYAVTSDVSTGICI